MVKIKITEDQLCPALLSIIPGAEMGCSGPLGTQGCIKAGVTLLEHSVWGPANTCSTSRTWRELETSSDF